MTDDVTARVRDDIAEAIHDADCEGGPHLDRDGECTHPAADVVLAVPLIAALLAWAPHAKRNIRINHEVRCMARQYFAMWCNCGADEAEAALDAVRRQL